MVKKSNLKSTQFISHRSDFQNYKNATLKFSLKENFELLCCFSDKLAIKFLKDKKLDNLLSNRNNSILTHGLIPAVGDDAEMLYQKLIDYSTETFSELNNCMESAKFPKSNDI